MNYYFKQRYQVTILLYLLDLYHHNYHYFKEMKRYCKELEGNYESQLNRQNADIIHLGVLDI